MAHKPFPQEAKNRSETPGERLMSDVFGPTKIFSIGGYKYFISFTDDATRFSNVLFLKEKSDAYDRITEYCNKVARHFGKYPKWLRFDNGKEYVNQKVTNWAASKGITLEMTAPYSSSQNGVAERFNRTHMELARSMLVARNLPSFLWDEAVAHANYLRNRVGTRSLQGKTPYEAWYGRKPDVSHLREFGCDVWVLDEMLNLSKLKPRAKKMIFTGFMDGSKSIRYYDPETRRIKVSRNISFHENEEPSMLDYITVIPGLPSEGETQDDSDKQAESQEEEMTSSSQPEVPRTVPVTLPTETRALRPRNVIDYKKSGNPDARKPSDRLTMQQNAPTSLPPVQNEILRFTPDPPDITRHTESSRAKAKERTLLAALEKYEDPPEIVPIQEPGLPNSVDEARSGPEAEQWEAAMQKEMDTLHRMGTWELVDLPSGRTAIGCRMVFAKKRDERGQVREYKARLVAQGFSQKPGVDFNHDGTFAPVMRFETLRTGLALAAVNKWKLRQFDVKGAYLNGYLDEEIYMRQPAGFDNGSG